MDQEDLLFYLENGSKEALTYYIPLGLRIPANKEMFLTAAGKDLVSIVRRQLAAWVGINKTDYMRRTAVSKAAESGAENVLKLLIRRGANLNLADTRGNTPLIFAAAKGHKNVAELLVDHGADMNAKIRYGETAFSTAMVKGNKEIALMMLKKGDLDQITMANPQALTYALYAGYEEIVEILRTRQHADRDGNTLILAAFYGQQEIVRDLVEKKIRGQHTYFHKPYEIPIFGILLVPAFWEKGIDLLLIRPV